ncbi:hypothetical protein BBJ29_005277 [Phytophthora kernoviae]|uniref:Vacuolar protein sorting-associated protein 13 VPS13 adaptor binding domain-containing protein n=1 Tax=Phytophthora kernoviae TaxID=325452 RepID=A0A421FYT7_9STRA|nr:hypothetical protein BBJ29_005277 [Phytophthora kernoviae]
MKAVDNFRHKFSLPYGGAQSGVTPILKIDVLTTDERKRNYVFDHVTNKYVEVEVDDDDLMDLPASLPITPPTTQRVAREDSANSTQRTKWSSVGSAEINLAGNVMASLDPNRMKLNRWYRLHDLRGNVTGEIFVGLHFVPEVSSPTHHARVNEPQQVKDGQFLVFDPLKIVAASTNGSTDECKDHVMLSDGLRGSYIPPLALEVMIGSSRMSLMCPLRRAGKFLIQGDNVLAEVKVAQRDESRRVLLLSSPVQLKNDTSIDMELWTCRTRLTPGESGVLPRTGKLMTLTTSNKISVPISAMFGEEKDSIIVKVDGCKPTVVADLNKLAAGSTILTLEAEDSEGLGYCLYVNITSHMRKVYREDHQGMITRGNMNEDGELQTYATKYQISLHSCLMFENTLPIRVQYKIVAYGLSEQVVRTGTLSPGEEVPIHDFQLDAILLLRLPEMDSIWSRPINMGDCIYREGMGKLIKSMLGAIGIWDPIVEFLPPPQNPGIDFKEGDISSNKVTTRLDYTAADDGSPRIVLFCSLWIYNQSHVQTLLFRCADNPDAHALVVPQLVPQRPVPRLMDCPGQAFEIGTIIDTEVSRWSDKIHSTVVGVQEPISLKFGSRHEVISRKYGVYDFANLDRERNIDALRYRMFGSKSKSVAGDIVVDRASRVLVFRDHNPDKPPSYILEVKIIAARLRNEISLKPDSTAEVIAETDNHGLSDIERVSDSYVTSEESEEDAIRRKERDSGAAGMVEIKIPKKAWTRLGVGAKRSIALSYNTAEQARRSLGRVEGHWWEMRDPESGDLVGEVLVALKFRTSVREHIQPSGIFNTSVIIPSIGLSFLHNANSSMVEVAYLSMQRLGLLYSRAGGSSEVVFSLGNLQMDNQMEREVVLGPKVHRVKEGVSVRLRDRWRSFMNYRYRGIFEELDTTNLSVIQFRMLWNSSCHAGEFTHYELIELIMQELEVSTDEKFVVNLISVFQGLEGLTSQHTFEEILNTQLDYAGEFNSGAIVAAAGADERSGVSGGGGKGGATGPAGGAEASGVYIEELAIEAIRINFTMELHGGRYIKTLGPSGRRLAVYLPESNVKDFHLHLTKLSFTHLYETQASVVEKVTRRYSQQAVILVLSGLHTVSVYANPFRIVYRLGHGVVELVRLPARGLASGSPLELISGAYLGVRSLAMNTISASYEIVAGATGILGAVLSPFVPESKRKAFEEDLVAFQRAVIEEVDAFDAAEERTMTKVIVRKPREFNAAGVGLLTVYGPGSVPLEEQERIDHKAVVLLQLWWRRRRRAALLLAEARRLRPESEDVDRVFGSTGQCAVQ